ncbi:MAG: phytanoyl-CoA dioxygenase family protein [Albidovulum sp.]|nr:phytanoyl-CoA dioxygenase family protein [Albidovulum sp.]
MNRHKGSFCSEFAKPLDARQFQREGYAIVERGVSEPELASLRQACDTLLAEPVDDGGGARHRIGLGKRRRFLAHRHESFPKVENLLLKGSVASLASRLLQPECYLFNEQFVVKGAGDGASFAWHQDGAYVGFDHQPYISVWIALDDANEENGCLRIIPRDLESRGYIDRHRWSEESRELCGYDGEDSGVPVTCAAGAVVLFSSLTLHCSGRNATPNLRRAFLAQYSKEPILDPDTGKLKRFAKNVSLN